MYSFRKIIWKIIKCDMELYYKNIYKICNVLFKVQNSEKKTKNVKKN